MKNITAIQDINSMIHNYIEGQSVTCDMFGQHLVDGDQVVVIPNLLNTKGDTYSFNRAICYTDGITGELKLKFSEVPLGLCSLHFLFSTDIDITLSQIIYKVTVDSKNFANTGIVDIFGNELSVGDLVLFSARDTVLNSLHNHNFTNHVSWNVGQYSTRCGCNTQGRDEEVYNCFGLLVQHAEVIKLTSTLSELIVSGCFGDSGLYSDSLTVTNKPRAYFTLTHNGKKIYNVGVGVYAFEVSNIYNLSEEDLSVLYDLLKKIQGRDIKLVVDSVAEQAYAQSLVGCESISYFTKNLFHLYLTKALSGDTSINRKVLRCTQNYTPFKGWLGVYDSLDISGDYTLMFNHKSALVKVRKVDNSH